MHLELTISPRYCISSTQIRIKTDLGSLEFQCGRLTSCNFAISYGLSPKKLQHSNSQHRTEIIRSMPIWRFERCYFPLIVIWGTCYWEAPEPWSLTNTCFLNSLLCVTGHKFWNKIYCKCNLHGISLFKQIFWAIFREIILFVQKLGGYLQEVQSCGNSKDNPWRHSRFSV